MRKIFIDDNIKAKAEDYKTALLKHKQELLDRIEVLRDQFDGKHKVEDDAGKNIDLALVSKYHNYLARLYKDFDNETLFLLPPSQFQSYHGHRYNKGLNDKDLKKKIKFDGDKPIPFHKRVSDAMGYGDIVRGEVFPSIIRNLGIKACVYCNANFVVAEKNGNGYFELDHWKPESKYPFLSTSFYNLQPCCPHCNKHKSSNTKLEFFQLYEEDPNEPLDLFEFSIPRGSLVRYFAAQDTSHIKVEFKAKETKSKKLRDDANERFGIEGIYNEHIDVVEEMMWRAKFYDNAILKSMAWFYKKRWKFIDIERFKLGTYAVMDEVHKRPLTKFMQDIGKQLEII